MTRHRQASSVVDTATLAAHLRWPAASDAQRALLECVDVQKSFGGVRAVTGLSLSVPKGGILGLIGPNGAGKSTALNVISGLLPPTSGTVRYEGAPLGGPMGARARRGIVRTFQKGRLFTSMNARDNVASAVGPHRSRRLLTWLAAPRRARRDEMRVQHMVDAIMELTGTADLGDAPVSHLPFGKRRMVELARAVAAGPQVLLLDEPAAGLNTVERQHLIALIRTLRAEFGTTVVLVEHDVGLVTELSDAITVMDQGHTIASGDPATVVEDPAVRAAYLGTTEDADA